MRDRGTSAEIYNDLQMCIVSRDSLRFSRESSRMQKEKKMLRNFISADKWNVEWKSFACSRYVYTRFYTRVYIHIIHMHRILTEKARGGRGLDWKIGRTVFGGFDRNPVFPLGLFLLRYVLHSTRELERRKQNAKHMQKVRLTANVMLPIDYVWSLTMPSASLLHRVYMQGCS